MGLPPPQPDDARHRSDPHRRADRGKAPPRLRPRRGAARRLILSILALCALAIAAAADPLRLATWHASLSRKGPGLLLRDILKADDPDIAEVIRGVVAARPDVLVLTDIDHDADHAALKALQARLAEAGHAMPHRFALRPNTGRATGLDLDGDGRKGGPRDAQGYGEFAGQGGMALLSRLPVRDGEAQTLDALLWRDLPGALIAGARLSPEARAVQRLSSAGHWIVPLDTGAGTLHVLMYHATTPVFDGPEDRNGRRNHDETALWLALLDGQAPIPPPPGLFVLIGDANTDPEKGEGRAAALRRLLADPRLQDPRPTHPGHGAHTVDWPEPDPGDLRVSYVLPSAGLLVLGAGVEWDAAPGVPHKLVWVDVALPQAP